MWPPLPLDSWRDTYATLHRDSQIVGKVKLQLTARVNHWWNVALHLGARGLTTGRIAHQGGAFELELDFVEHVLRLRKHDGMERALALGPRPVAIFYREAMALLGHAGLAVRIRERPVELLEDAIPFPRDFLHASYDPGAVERWWLALAHSARVFEHFRARFVGKCSPVHFFWGGFDLACSRFSGRRAPERPGADAITREAYSHETISAGFWPGDARYPAPAFYAYAAPTPPGLEAVRPAGGFWHAGLGEFLLPYQDVRRSLSPERALMDFLQSTYAAAADLAGWDRAALERASGEAPRRPAASGSASAPGHPP